MKTPKTENKKATGSQNADKYKRTPEQLWEASHAKASGAPAPDWIKASAPETRKSWLWPDHVISKRESRRLREEHNRVVDEAEWLENEVKHFGKCFDGEHSELLKSLAKANHAEKLAEALRAVQSKLGEYEGKGDRRQGEIIILAWETTRDALAQWEASKQ